LIIQTFRLQADTSVYFEDKVKKKFERFQSPESHSKSQERKNNRNIVDSPISHLPIKEQENMKEQFEKENRQNNFQTMNKVNKRKLHEINELFIIKLVFDALNHVFIHYFGLRL